ncbi:MAG: holo-ACP synthase [Bacillota bacterium]|jgi:holo-[acyl-carrier protein] synthase
MIFGVGTDIVEISRLQKIVERSPKMLSRVFTAAEIAYCEKKGNMIEAFAARFAAKEAILKALGTGITGFSWLDMEISNLKSGKPVVNFCGSMQKFLQEHHITQVEISFSHVQDTAMAFAVACCEYS